MASLRLVPVSGQPVDVVKDQSVVGRDPSCEIVVSDGSVSRRHARLERRGGAWWVVDQGSANGTYLNSLRIAEQALKHGQELRFGALAFRVDLKEDPEATVATPIALVDNSATVMAQPSRPRRRQAHAAPADPEGRASAAPAAGRSAERRRREGALQGNRRTVRTRCRAGAADTGRAAPMKKARARSSGSASAAAAACCCARCSPAPWSVSPSSRRAAPRRDARLARAGAPGPDRRGPGRPQLRLQEPRRRAGARAPHPGDRELQGRTFMSRSIETTARRSRACLTGGGGPPQPVVVHLVKEGGAWKIDKVTLGTE
jgi:predicted component of type VI protein secretion system